MKPLKKPTARKVIPARKASRPFRFSLPQNDRREIHDLMRSLILTPFGQDKERDRKIKSLWRSGE